MELIDKSKLLEGLKKLRQNLSASPIVVIEDVESFVESLEIKEVDYNNTIIERACELLARMIWEVTIEENETCKVRMNVVFEETE